MSDDSDEKAVPISDTVGSGEGEATEGQSGGGGTTMATQKKRLRRVSFAEMTSVHFFDRDEEDNETPKEQQQSVGKGGNGDVEKEEILGFLQMMGSKGEDVEEGEAVESEEEDVEHAAMQRPFLRPIESPSSGSGFGSATSNDEDFFGPVSASFIKHGCLSDSEASDDNRDVTMDSTAFSMHFRSIARSESGVDLKTPTGLHLAFEVKPPGQTAVGNTMELTVSRKLLSTSPSPTGKRTAYSNSSDMSLVGESPSKYDYGKFSPELDALLAEGTKTLISDCNSTAFDSPRNLGNVSFSQRENLTVASEATSNSGDMPFAPQENLVKSVVVIGANKKAVDSLQGLTGEANGHGDILHESPLVDFISSLSKQRQKAASSTSPIKYISILTPQQRGYSSLREEVDNCRSSSSIHKSISKLNLLEASPFSASFDSRFKDLNIKSHISKPSPFKFHFEREVKNFLPKYVDASSGSVESQLLVGSAKIGAQISESSADNSNVLDEVGRENIPSTEESNAAGVSSSSFSGRNRSSGTLAPPVTSPESQMKLTVPEHQNLNGFFLPDQCSFLQSSGLKENGVGINLSTEPLDRSESCLWGTRLHFGSPVVNLKGNKDVSTFDKQDVWHLIENHGTPVKENISLTNSRDMDASMDPYKGIPESSRNPLWGEPQSAHFGSSVLFQERNIKELMLPQNAEEPFPSASKKEFPITGRKHMDPHHIVDYSAPTSNQLKSRKRSEILDFGDTGVVAFQQRSPKLRKVVVHDSEMLGGFNEDQRETKMAQESKNWADMYSNLVEDGEGLALSSVDFLKLSVIDSFEDVLRNSKKAKTYGMLCNEILPQKTSISHDHQSERVGEIRLLLHQITHEKSKLQLMLSKKKLLMEKLQQITTGVREMQMLKMNLLPKFAGGTPAVAHGLRNFFCIKHSDEDTNEKVAALKQSLEALNKKKDNFVKVLHGYCKIKEEKSNFDCILLANDLLMKKSCHRFIRLGMQIWGVQNVRNGNDIQEVLVNYLGFVIQSFKFASCPASSIVISNKVDDVNIIKSFLNMDACTAFSSVLNAETTQKYLDPQSLASEMQVRSSFIGNLIDVVRELQLAQIELNNLTRANFHCPKVGQLNMHLNFFSFKHGKRVLLTFDMACLNRGIYPSEMLPSQVAVSYAGNTVLAEPITHKIQHVVKSLRAGYLRILRLCRCVSLTVECSQ